jgi:hypothetical protein
VAKPTLTAEEQSALNEVNEACKRSTDYLKPYRTKCDELYAHYRG